MINKYKHINNDKIYQKNINQIKKTMIILLSLIATFIIAILIVQCKLNQLNKQFKKINLEKIDQHKKQINNLQQEKTKEDELYQEKYKQLQQLEKNEKDLNQIKQNLNDQQTIYVQYIKNINNTLHLYVEEVTKNYYELLQKVQNKTEYVKQECFKVVMNKLFIPSDKEKHLKNNIFNLERMFRYYNIQAEYSMICAIYNYNVDKLENKDYNNYKNLFDFFHKIRNTLSHSTEKRKRIETILNKTCEQRSDEEINSVYNYLDNDIILNIYSFLTNAIKK